MRFRITAVYTNEETFEYETDSFSEAISTIIGIQNHLDTGHYYSYSLEGDGELITSWIAS